MDQIREPIEQHGTLTHKLQYQFRLILSAFINERYCLNETHLTLAHEADAGLRKQISEALSKALGKEALVRFTADPAVLGGSVVRMGDRVHDGSLRRKLIMLRRQLLNR